MNPRDQITNDSVSRPINHGNAPDGHGNISGYNPLPVNNNKTMNDTTANTAPLAVSPDQPQNGTRLFNTVRSDADVPANNIPSSAVSAQGNTRMRSSNAITNRNNVPPHGNIPASQGDTLKSNNQNIAKTSAADRNSADPVDTSNVMRGIAQNSVSNPSSNVNPNNTRVMPGNNTNMNAQPNTERTNNGAPMNRPIYGNVPSGMRSPASGSATGPASVQNPNNTTRLMPRAPINVPANANGNPTRIMPGVQSQHGAVSSSPNTNTSMNSTVRNAHQPLGNTANKPIQNINGAPHINNNSTTVMGRVPVRATGVPERKTAVMPAVRPSSATSKTPEKRSASTGKKKRKQGGNPFIGVLKFVLYISFVVVVSILLAKYFIGVGNDMFAFVKESYNFTDTVYSLKGETTNALKVSETNLSGDKFEFSYSFKHPLSNEELDNLDASCMLIKTSDNSVVHNYGKFTEDVVKGNPIEIDLANGDMSDDVYVLRFTVNTGNNISYITEFTISKKIAHINVEENASAGDIAKELKSKGIIDHPAAFKLYLKIKTDDGEKPEFVAGAHTLYHGMDYDEIIAAITPKRNVRSIVKLTFPEGSTVDDIINILIKGGVKNSKQDYINAMKNYADFDYRFINLLKEQGFSNERVYPLEGYLFPDTYEFYTDSSPQTVIDKFLANFDAKFDTSFYDEAERLGLTVDEIVTIASLVEAEAGNSDDKGNISSVFHNRLNNAVTFPYLESDATTDYASYDLRSDLKLTEYKCRKCGEKDVKSSAKCSKCGNNNTFEDYKCASFSINLADYNLIDGNYYINFNVRTDTTRSVVLIDINKKTSGDKVVYTIKSKSSTDTPAAGDLKVSIVNAQISANGVLTCEFKMDHGFNSDAFLKFPIKLNLFRKAYNTYLTPGIMPGAVANPGYESIIAALYPNSTNYYFFVADNAGNSHFSTTNEQHNAKIAELERDGRSVTAN